MRIPPELRCPDHGERLSPDAAGRVEDTRSLVCPSGCHFRVVDKIPRFVDSSDYAAAFGLQWNAFRKTQLDSHTGTTISRDRLTRCLGGSLDAVRGRSVLEAGCGAGRFTEILLAAGARVSACDLSTAVEANYANCSGWPDYFVCQANILRLPFAPQSFDVVLCLGVIQHTPDPKETIEALARFVRPGGMLVIDHYSRSYPYPLPRRLMRGVLTRLPPRVSKRAALGVARALLPVHRMFWTGRRGASRLRSYLSRISPLVDYYGAYPQLDRKLLGEWAVLDTHDTLTDHYKHLRSAEEIAGYLASCGLLEVEAYYGGNGVEARARRAAG